LEEGGEWNIIVGVEKNKILVEGQNEIRKLNYLI